MTLARSQIQKKKKIGNYKSVYDLADNIRYWYLQVKEGLIKLDLSLFYWKENCIFVCILAMLMTGFGNVMKTLKSILSIILRTLSCSILQKQKLSHTWAYH